eukprot:TRINITY_DN2420_c0_g1_i8.p2 TRINITY_DN2420_c0_g1~~TRINITY_DN2420_c0_g1_i8.p2  ORF type:complete len:116 (+),score=28.01 TRINITY_DN2420_c0_g1_i8:329-676(+)
MLHHMNDKVFVLHNNQQIIDKETKQLRAECIKFYKEANNWVALYNDLNESLKQLGDVVNWGKTIEDDLKTLVEARAAKSGGNSPTKSQGIRIQTCLLYTSPSPRDGLLSRMPSSA